MPLQLLERHLPPERRAVVEHVQAQALRVRDDLAVGRREPRRAEGPLARNDPIEHLRPAGNFAHLERRDALEDAAFGVPAGDTHVDPAQVSDLVVSADVLVGEQRFAFANRILPSGQARGMPRRDKRRIDGTGYVVSPLDGVNGVPRCQSDAPRRNIREQRPQAFGDREVRDNGITQLRVG